jgi:AAA domain
VAAETPTLHMICGKIAAGKSTLAPAPGRRARHDPDQRGCLAGHALLRRTAHGGRVRPQCPPSARGDGGHIEDLLRAGLSVVLDFPANTVANRQWMRGLFEKAGAAHRLHVIDVPDAVCKARLLQRNAAGTHEFTVSDAEFDEITGYLVPPSADEGFETTVYRDA